MVTEPGMGPDVTVTRPGNPPTLLRRYVVSLLAKTNACTMKLSATGRTCKANRYISVRDMPGTERARKRRHKHRAQEESLLGGSHFRVSIPSY